MECWSIGVIEKKKLFTTTVLSFLIAAPTTQGMRTHDPDTHAQRIQSIRPFELNRKSIVMAQNEQKAAENQSPSASENHDQTASSGAAKNENSSNNSDADAAKPLKPFKPSEEIAAEQAVDFPVDI